MRERAFKKIEERYLIDIRKEQEKGNLPLALMIIIEDLLLRVEELEKFILDANKKTTK